MTPDPLTELGRRDLMRSVGAAGAVLAVAAALPWPAAAADDGEVFTPPGLPRDLPADAGRHPRATIAARVPFDLDDPAGYQLAKLKVQVNLIGRTSYLSVLTRHYLCREGVPAVPFVNELELFTMYIERPDADGLPVQRSMFTRRFLDAATNRPLRSLAHPGTGQTVTLRDTLFALSLPVKLSPDVTQKEPSTIAGTVRETDQPYMRFGQYIDFVPLAIRQGEGAHQPSLDTSTWRTEYAALMDPDTPLIDAHYAFAAFARASLYGWSGYVRGDATQMFSTKSGIKVNSPEALPALVRQLLVEKYPNRV